MSNQTFLEYIRVDQQETVMANILAYFLTSNNPHGLGSIFSEALLQTKFRSLETHDEKGRITAVSLPEDFINIDAVTEVSTDERNRIDILVRNEKLVICIEFKINHILNNNLQSYKDRVLKHHSGKKQYYIVLTPTWKKPEFPKGSYNCTDFKQVMLNDFITQVEQLIEERNPVLNVKQRYYLEDFIQTFKNRRKIVELYNLEQKEGTFYSPEEKNQVMNFIEGKVKSLYEYIDSSDLVFNNKAGELEAVITKEIPNFFSKKVRLTLKGWQLENWGNKHQMIEKYLPLDASFEELKKYF